MHATTIPPETEGPRRLHHHLYVQVLIAIVAGAVLGHFQPDLGAALKPLGDGFIKLVKMVIAPVIFLTLVSGIAGLRELRAVGRVAGKAFGYFLFFSTLALIVGLIVANVVQPGAGMHINPATLDTGAVADYAAKAHDSTLTAFLLNIIPDTLISALTQGNILQVLLVAILFGVALSLVGEPARPILDLIERLNIVVFRIVAILMRVAPLGAFGAIAFTVGTIDSVAASVMKPAPVTPAAPFDDSIATLSSSSCWPIERSTSHACAMNSAASVM